MKIGKLTKEHLIYGLAILLAMGLRFIGLGNTPLSDTEASSALQALSAFQPGHVISGGQPGYVLLTAVNFFLTGSSEFFARFWPAVFGTLLVLVPYLGRERLGQKAALVMAFAVAIEPSLVAVSRQADGRMLAITGLAFAGISHAEKCGLGRDRDRVCDPGWSHNMVWAAGDRYGMERVPLGLSRTLRRPGNRDLCQARFLV